MFTLATLVVALIVCGAVIRIYPRSWIGIIIFLATAATPLAIPSYIKLSGINIYFVEVAILLGALHVLFSYKPRLITDISGLTVVTVTLVFAFIGVAESYPLRDVAECRWLVMLGVVIFVFGRISSTDMISTVLTSVKVSLWFSLGTTVLATLVGLQLVGRSDDASLLGESAAPVGVLRLITPATQLAAAALAVALALWALRPSLTGASMPYVIPAVGIVVMAFSRNSVLVVALALGLAPIFNRNARAFARAIFIACVGLALYFLTGFALSSLGDISVFGGAKRIYDAYAGRVVAGIFNNSAEADSSLLYRQVETNFMLRAIQDNQAFGHGYGYAYKPPRNREALSTAQYGHNYYMWTLVKSGFAGLTLYMTAYLGPILNGIRAGSNVFSSACAATATAFLAVSWVVPFPISMSTAPVLGALIGGAAGLRARTFALRAEERSAPIRSTGTDQGMKAPGASSPQ